MCADKSVCEFESESEFMDLDYRLPGRSKVTMRVQVVHVKDGLIPGVSVFEGSYETHETHETLCKWVESNDGENKKTIQKVQVPIDILFIDDVHETEGLRFGAGGPFHLQPDFNDTEKVFFDNYDEWRAGTIDEIYIRISDTAYFKITVA
jgi:hypothetical protein